MRRRGMFASLLVMTLLLLFGCAEKPVESAFTLRVVPQELKGFSIAGQRIHYLVTLGEENITDPVKISATASGAEVEVVQTDIVSGKVAEVIVIPKPDSVGKSVDVLIEGKRGSVTDKKTMTFEVIEGEDDRKEKAEELLKLFLPYLTKTHPDWEISEDTLWTGTMVSPQWLVVSHYLFFSEEWEIHLEWHVMIPPDDWARIDLRHRADETVPSSAFEISSVTEGGEPVPMEVPEEIWR